MPASVLVRGTFSLLVHGSSRPASAADGRGFRAFCRRVVTPLLLVDGLGSRIDDVQNAPDVGSLTSTQAACCLRIATEGPPEPTATLCCMTRTSSGRRDAAKPQNHVAPLCSCTRRARVWLPGSTPRGMIRYHTIFQFDPLAAVEALRVVPMHAAARAYGQQLILQWEGRRAKATGPVGQ